MRRKQRLYLQVAEILTDHILSGKISPGEKLKTEAELCKQFDVSRATVREALGHLESRGFITRKHGIGSFVLGAADGIVAGLETLESFTATIGRSGHKARELILDIEKIRIKEQLATKMEVKTGSLGYSIKALRLADGVPVNYSVDTLYAQIINDPKRLNRRSQYESLLDFLDNEFDIHANYGFMYLDAIEAPQM